MTTPIRIKGFTNEVLSWKPWLDPVDVGTATRPSWLRSTK